MNDIYYECQGQYTIFDMIPTQDITDLSDEEIVSLISDRVGVKFNYNAFYHAWEAKLGDLKLTIGMSHYNLDDNHNRFISVGYDRKSDHSGGGAPCDTIDEAVRWFRKKVTV